MENVTLSILQNKMVESGNDIVLRCSVNNASGPITYKFYREKEVRPFYQNISSETKAFWFKTQASKEHEGQYYCTASNRANSAKNVPQSNILTVRGESGPQQRDVVLRPESSHLEEEMGGSLALLTEG